MNDGFGVVPVPFFTSGERSDSLYFGDNFKARLKAAVASFVALRCL